MRIQPTLWIAAVFFIGACSGSSESIIEIQSQDTSDSSDPKSATPVTMYPILKYSRNQTSDVLLQHEASDAEKHLFEKMDSAVVALEGDPDLDQCYEAIVPIGAEAGLDEEQSIAFWTRMTFSEFEP